MHENATEFVIITLVGVVAIKEAEINQDSFSFACSVFCKVFFNLLI